MWGGEADSKSPLYMYMVIQVWLFWDVQGQNRQRERDWENCYVVTLGCRCRTWNVSFSAVMSHILTVQFVLQMAAKRLNCGWRSFSGSLTSDPCHRLGRCWLWDICFSKGLTAIFVSSIPHQTRISKLLSLHPLPGKLGVENLCPRSHLRDRWPVKKKKVNFFSSSVFVYLPAALEKLHYCHSSYNII